MEANGQDIASSPQYNGKIMLSAVIILFAACAMVVIFHMYSKWCTAARPVRQLQQSTRRRYTTTTEEAALAWKGLDLAVVNALPAFIYESKTRESPLECAVCLSEFEDGENGRLLPQCKHSFHVDCIDMWFGSHSDCPLCRARVKVEVVGADPVQLAEDPNEIILSIILPKDTDQGSCSGSSPEVPLPSHMCSGSDGNLGSDIESGQRSTTGSVKVLKRLFSI